MRLEKLALHAGRQAGREARRQGSRWCLQRTTTTTHGHDTRKQRNIYPFAAQKKVLLSKRRRRKKEGPNSAKQASQSHKRSQDALSLSLSLPPFGLDETPGGSQSGSHPGSYYSSSGFSRFFLWWANQIGSLPPFPPPPKKPSRTKNLIDTHLINTN
jgi:hypothetical protein